MTETAMFAVDAASRTVRGILIPWGVRSRESSSRTKPIVFPPGSIRVPRDPSVVSLNSEHDRFMPIGRAVELEDQPTGLYAAYVIADTDDGDAWLADHDGVVGLSAELRDIVRNADDTGTAYLTGSAVVRDPAFVGAGLFSAAAAVPGTDPAPSPVPDDVPDVDDDGADELPDTLPDAPAPDEDTDDASASTDTGPNDSDNEHDEDEMPDATLPGNMLASRRTPTTSSSSSTDAPLSASGLFAAVRLARTTGDRSALMPYAAEAAEVGLFALTNIKYDGGGGLVTDALMPGTWLGQLWGGKRFTRRIVPLLTAGTLTSLNATGWTWGIKPAMSAWLGNKTPVPSNAPTVVPKSFPATRFAGGHDLAIEYYHFGQTDVIDAYAEAMIDSYAELSDAYALVELTAGATPYTPDAGNTVNKGLLDVVDGALAVVAGGGTPSYSIVAPDVYKNIYAAPKEDSLEFFNASLGLEGGTASQGFAIVPDGRLAPGAIIVGDKGGATAWELPEVPIRVEANDLVLGGVDNAFFGYIGVGVTNPNVVVKNPAAVLLEGVEESVIVAAEKSRK